MNTRVKRAIIVGIGGHAHVWKKALDEHPDWELAAIVDTDTDKLEHAPNSWGIDRKEAFTTIEEAIQFGKGSYDLAILVTPTYTHHVLAMESLEVGLNVLSEKNLASSIDQGRQMVKAANENPHLCTAAGTQTRYFPQNWSLKKYYLEHKKALGKITSLNFSYLYNWGKTRQGWRRWLKDLFLEDMAPHHFDLMRYLTDMDIVQVQGAANFKPSFSYFKGSSTTFAVFALSTPENYENPDNWIYATYRGDWQKKGKLQHTVELNYEGGELNLIEIKKDKKIEISIFDDAEGFQYHDEPVPITSDVEYNKKNYSSELFLLEELSIGIDSKGKIQPKTNYNDAFKSFAVSRGIVESFETGNSVYLPKYWKNLPI